MNYRAAKVCALGGFVLGEIGTALSIVFFGFSWQDAFIAAAFAAWSAGLWGWASEQQRRARGTETSL